MAHEKEETKTKKTYSISCYSEKGTVIDVHSSNLTFIDKCCNLLESYKMDYSLKITTETIQNFYY